MDEVAQGDVTQLLNRWKAGNSAAENELFALVMPNLRRLAHHFMSRERDGHSLQATELVDSIYFRLVAARERDWLNRKHFFAIAARAMRRHLIDHARGRPPAEFVPLPEADAFAAAALTDPGLVITMDRLLDELGEARPEWCNLVELKYFLGMTDEEAADVMALKLRTMQRMWRDARLWLFTRMESGHGAGAGR